ncbi:MAG: hypothetical protein KBA32_16960, partial [Propionivibrio sp.]|uniref:hypothetical protein n=1 Tax=Propionivibrio sp. TaxID=2212460 RepID=UPI001B448563
MVTRAPEWRPTPEALMLDLRVRCLSMCLKKLGNRRILAQRPDCQIADSRCEEITNYNYPFAFVKMAGRLSP